uniref:Acyl-CoA binding domain containing 4 n=1 Tax=Leptobrachium leishanense TaxID=445787 RepID=A0A8C5QDC6_9ANUR
MGTDEDETEHQRQFSAAVSVIQGLPKNGAYRPSYEEMLRFYSYYKQATLGPCSIPRPGFWDPIGRYKWDAWNQLGDMTQEDAMCAYINEMKSVAQKIIDTVPLDDQSPDMFEPFRPLYEVIPDMPRPPDSFFETSSDSSLEVYSPLSMTELVEKRHIDLLNSTEEEPESVLTEAVCSPSPSSSTPQTSIPQDEPVLPHSLLDQQEAEKRCDPIGAAAHPVKNIHSWESSSDYFCDSMEEAEPVQELEGLSSLIEEHHFQSAEDAPVSMHHSSEQKTVTLRDPKSDIEIVPQSTSESWPGSQSEPSNSNNSSGSQVEKEHFSQQLSPQIAATVAALHDSIQGICQRLEGLEKLLQGQQVEEPPHQPDKETPQLKARCM